MPNAIIIKQSKFILIIIVVVSGLLTLLGKSMLGDYGLFEALAHGKLIGKFAFFTIIMGLVTVGGFIGIFKNLRRVVIDSNGITHIEVGVNRCIPWHAITGIEKVSGGVGINTQQGTVIIGQYMMCTNKIIRGIETYKQNMSVNMGRAPGARLFQ